MPDRPFADYFFDFRRYFPRNAVSDMVFETHFMVIPTNFSPFEVYFTPFAETLGSNYVTDSINLVYFTLFNQAEG